jgi:competence protein ComEA
MGKVLRLGIVVATLLFSAMTFSAEVVDINRATAETMIQNWKGIGEVKAKAIVAYRKKNGSFKSIDELANVKGVGEGLIKKNRKYMSVKGGLAKPSATASKQSSSSSAKSTSKSKSDTSKSKSTADKKKSSSSSKKSSSSSKKSSSDKKKPAKKKKTDKKKKKTDKKNSTT